MIMYSVHINTQLIGLYDSELNMRRNFGNFMANGIYGEREIL